MGGGVLSLCHLWGTWLGEFRETVTSPLLPGRTAKKRGQAMVPAPSPPPQLPTPWGQPGVPTGPVVRAGPGSGGGEGLAWPTELGLSPPGFSSPCTFVAAVSGANGSVLWERPAAQDGALVQCSVPQLQGGRTSSACVLVGRPGSFIAVDLFTGRRSPPGAPTPGRSEEVQPVFLGLADTAGKRFRGLQGGVPPPGSPTSPPNPVLSPPSSVVLAGQQRWEWGSPQTTPGA